jgi:hypothetical protein
MCEEGQRQARRWEVLKMTSGARPSWARLLHTRQEGDLPYEQIFWQTELLAFEVFLSTKDCCSALIRRLQRNTSAR